MKNLFGFIKISILSCFSLLLFSSMTSYVHEEKEESQSDENAEEIRKLGLDQLPHVVFWRKIMNLDKDSCLVNVHQDRTIFCTYHAKSWYSADQNSKGAILDSFKRIYQISDSPRIVGTGGKSFFYTFDKVAPKIQEGMDEFKKNGVDGWYAKAILLIESPNQLQKSPAGAYGPFQLMRGVARNYGLVVNKKVDERKNFKRSAYAASSLIKKICIPYTKAMLEDKNIEYNEDDLWFRLLVMHVYNAGAGNVKMALALVPSETKGIEIIKTLWNTEAGRFRSSSQNYSQLILAAFLEYEDQVVLKKS